MKTERRILLLMDTSIGRKNVPPGCGYAGRFNPRMLVGSEEWDQEKQGKVQMYT